MISHKELLHVCHYDPATGYFTWLNPPFHKKKAGTRMGSLKQCGYVQIKISNEVYYAGPLAWFYVTGEWPPNDVDHKNRIRWDNRFDNLRLCTKQQNAGNTSISVRNQSRYKGVSRTSGGKWRASLKRDEKTVNLGDFYSNLAAALAYDKAAFQHFGEFANLNFPKSVHRDWLLVCS
jgi:hypothetical protein